MTSRHISAAVVQLVRERAGHCCEYCHLPQASQEATFHIDHILPLVRGGKTTPDNLALACVGCSLKKGARTHARDPVTDEVVDLFHPRTELWEDHFVVGRDFRIRGKTPGGRATIAALELNRPILRRIRKWLSRR